MENISWRFADILRHFPVFELDGQIWVDVEGERLTRQDVLDRWSAHCNETGNRRKDEQSASPSKSDIIQAVKAHRPAKGNRH